MNTINKAVLLSILVIMLASCSSSTPIPSETPTPIIVILTNTPKPTSTATETSSPVPPTDTLTPVPPTETLTSVPPTETPTETPSTILLFGDWRWEITPYWGYLHITQDGNTFTGTLDDEYEGTRGDKIVDGEIIDNSIKFTRDGLHGIQYWEGIISEANGTLTINGRWKVGDSGSWKEFVAEKIK